ncbi:MAG: DUF1302 family protein [Thiohalomonadales bacterium]
MRYFGPWFFLIVTAIIPVSNLVAEVTAAEPEFDNEVEFDLEFDPNKKVETPTHSVTDTNTDIIDIELDDSFINEGSTKTVRSAFRYTLDHEISLNPANHPALINNRTGAQVEFEKLITTNVYAKLDVIGNLYWSTDHVSKTAKKTVQTYGRIKEAWIQRSWQSVNLKVGKQIIVWSDVDSSRATDLINPSDNRELIFIDFEDARLGQWMISASYFNNNVSWQGFINLLPEFNDLPPHDSIYNFTASLPPFPVIDAETPDPEAGIRAKIRLGAAELAILTANLAPNQPAFESVNEDFANQTIREKAVPFWLTGLNFNYASGKFLWKTDLAYKTNQQFNYLDSLPPGGLPLIAKDVVDVAVGVEYNQNQHSIDFSITRTIIKNWQESMFIERQTGLFLLNWRKPFLNEELSIVASYGRLYAQSSQYVSFYADYAYDDHLSLIGSLFLFDIADTISIFSPLKDNDRLSLKIKYQF